MVSRNSPPNPSSGMLHQFIVSDSIARQNQFQTQHFDSYGSALMRGNNTFPQSLGLPSIQSLGERMSRSMDLLPAPVVTEESDISHTRHFMDIPGAPNETSSHQNQRLSLSLGSCMLVPSVLVSGAEDREVCNQGVEHIGDGYSFPGSSFASASNSLNRSCSITYGDGAESFATAIGKSRYLRSVQFLLKEVVNVGASEFEGKSVRMLYLGGKRGGLTLSSELRAEFCSSEAMLPEKNELQIRIAKLIALLEEVEIRYEKYCNQMEDLVSSFEALAGLGAAKCYTALALQAMSRHFGSLRDAIVSQINATGRKLSHDLPRVSTGLSQLSLFDRETRHNRLSVQQLGIIQSQRQAWRPIRGLPETSVAILRSWLFEHFLHPYPTDSEKLMLASQTGLTKNQVSNWFINARVRLWKPMIEEMYREEFADSSEEMDQTLGSNFSAGEGVADQDED